MSTRLRRSINEPIRGGLSWADRWQGIDRGLICCWERGRQLKSEDPALASRADQGELAILVWKGGVEEKIKGGEKSGTLQYLAMWQGLRGEDLDIDVEGERVIVCSRTGQPVSFNSKGSSENSE